MHIIKPKKNPDTDSAIKTFSLPIEKTSSNGVVVKVLYYYALVHEFKSSCVLIFITLKIARPALGLHGTLMTSTWFNRTDSTVDSMYCRSVITLMGRV